MIPRAESDHPVDKIRFGLMMAMGGEDASDTIDQILEQETITLRELDEVPQRAEARGPEFLEFSEESRTKLLATLDDYLQWLSRSKEALETADEAATVGVYQESQDILPSLTQALERYSRDFASFGPFETIPANTLLRICDAIQTKELEGGAWTQYCAEYAKWTAARTGALLPLELPGKAALQDAYQAFASCLAEIRQDIPSDSASVKGKLQELDQAFHRAEIVEAKMAKAEDGPTNMLPVNVLLLFLEDPKSELAKSAIEEYGELMDGYAEQFEQAASVPVESALVQEEIPRTLDTLDSHYSAVEEIGEALEADDSDKLQEAIKKLIETSKRLEESQDVYATAAQHQSQITCPTCGRSNPPENRNCEACGEILPRPEGVQSMPSSTFNILAGPALEENQQLEMTENVARLYQACDDVVDGKITIEKFASELDFAKAGMKEFSEELDGLAATALDEDNFTPEQLEVWQSTHLPYLDEIAGAYTVGLEEVEQGLKSMDKYFEDPDKAHLIEGIRLTWQGLSTIHRARLSVETYTNMLTDVMQEAADEGLLSLEAEE